MSDEEHKTGRGWYINTDTQCAFVSDSPCRAESCVIYKGPAVTGTREEAILLGIDPEKYLVHWRTKIDPRDLI